MIHTAQADSRILNLSLAALHLIAAETDSDVPYIIALLTEPRRADAPGAQTVRAAVPAPTSPAGSDAVAIPAFLRARPHRPQSEAPPASAAEPPPARLTPTGWVQPEVIAPVRVSDPIKARVLRLRSMRPTWTAGMIAKDLGLTREMVEAALAGEKEAAR